MKNLVHENKNLNDLPRKESFTHIPSNKRFYRRDRYKGEYHKVDDIYPYTRIKRILRKYKGKQFDKAFAEYCSQVPQYQQKYFLEELQRYLHYPNRNYWSYWYVDTIGNIQYNPGTYKKNKTVYFYSDDFKTERRHKVTGKRYDDVQWWSSYWRRGNKESDFENVVISGYCLEFSSANDPEYKRLTADQQKRKKAKARAQEKEKNAKTFSFISKSEQEAKKEKENNKLKIERKGFDFATSFRAENQINPEYIAQRQLA